MFLKDNFIVPFLYLIRAFEVARKRLTKNDGYLGLKVTSALYLQNDKIHKKYELTNFNQNILNYAPRGSSGVVY